MTLHDGVRQKSDIVMKSSIIAGWAKTCSFFSLSILYMLLYLFCFLLFCRFQVYTTRTSCLQTNSNSDLGTVELYSALRLLRQLNASIEVKLLKNESRNSLITILIQFCDWSLSSNHILLLFVGYHNICIGWCYLHPYWPSFPVCITSGMASHLVPLPTLHILFS